MDVREGYGLWIGSKHVGELCLSDCLGISNLSVLRVLSL